MNEIKRLLKKEYDVVDLNDTDIKIIKKIIDVFEGKEQLVDINVFETEARSVKYLFDLNEYQKITDFIERKKLENEIKCKEQKIMLIKVLLFNEIKSYDELSTMTGIETREIKKTLQSKTLVSEYSKSTFLKLGEKISVLDSFEKEKETQEKYNKKRLYKFKLYDDYLWMYLNSRNKLSALSNGINNTVFSFKQDIESGEFADNYPQDILKMVEDKGEFLRKHKEKKNVCLIRDGKMIDIVKDDVFYVSPYIINKLQLVLTFFDYYGNIERMLECENNLSSYNGILSSLMLPELEDYLKEDAYLKLSKYLEIEKTYQSTICWKRLELVKNNFLEYSGNLYYALENCDDKETVLRLLGDKLVKNEFGNEIYQRTIEMLNSYGEKKKVLDELKEAKSLSL